MKSPVLELLFSSDVIAQRVRELSLEISSDYKDCRPIFICVLKGAFIFMSDLVRHLTVEADLDFLQVSSYGSGRVSSGIPALRMDIAQRLAGRQVLIIEDIVDTGQTVAFLREHIQEHNPESVKTCCLIDKREGRTHSHTIDYAAFTISDGFVVGYGLDFDECFRGLPAIYKLAPA